MQNLFGAGQFSIVKLRLFIRKLFFAFLRVLKILYKMWRPCVVHIISLFLSPRKKGQNRFYQENEKKKQFLFYFFKQLNYIARQCCVSVSMMGCIYSRRTTQDSDEPMKSFHPKKKTKCVFFISRKKLISSALHVTIKKMLPVWKLSVNRLPTN